MIVEKNEPVKINKDASASALGEQSWFYMK
jgi:hypothetical protein